ncbi:MAG: triose-phosphate isomerase [Deltaproteobacteria bacterium]|nr:triose-phosphate isomerase [Deltaproteobacteria bacterium]
MRRPFIAGNWKMHKTIREAVDFANQLKNAQRGYDDREVVIAPPFPALYAVAEVLKESGIRISAQNLHEKPEGAYTGEVSAGMLIDAGCEYVIVGHSERRTLFGEKNDVINRKLKTALSFGLRPIFCIGEILEEREEGRTFTVVEKQIKEGLNNLTTDDIRHLFIAYEPVWAIGTGKTATPEQAQEVHAFIRDVMGKAYGRDVSEDIAVIYGGSVNPGNIGGLMVQADIDGALVGGASLDIDSFVRIIRF